MIHFVTKIVFVHNISLMANINIITEVPYKLARSLAIELV